MACNIKTMNNQNNPQEVPQVKSVEELYKLMDEECPFVIHPSVKPYIIEAMKLYASQFQSRIAELEKQNAMYKEALKEINEIVCDVRISSQPKVYSVIRLAEQALNPKDNV